MDDEGKDVLMINKSVLIGLIFFLFVFPLAEVAAKGKGVEIPNSVVSIAKENTYPNPSEEAQRLEPSALSKELMESANIPIENPRLIKMLNESVLKTTPLAVGYRAQIFLGEWPLSYQSQDTTVNWNYYIVNENVLDNRGQELEQILTYKQMKQQRVEGGLTSKVADSEAVKQMMLQKGIEKTKLPLASETVIGLGTKKEQIYHVAPGKYGQLISYIPAVSEKGTVIYGEVFLVLKGSKKMIEVKNVTKKGISAQFPVQDHLSFQYQAK